jgi:16S rRNA C967 or C1407 C5-methylase (RsmB/RsmF family)/NOL1/NOP2/fmu family ribosome biogenesis protein
MRDLGESLIGILSRAVGPDRARVAFEAFHEEASVSIRLNPFKMKEPPFPVAGQVPWSRYGYMLDSRPVFTLDPLFHAGCYYVQDSSAMAVGEVFRKCLDSVGISGGPLRVLDLCAAPGGKTTDLACSLRERLGEGFSLVANEVVRSRASVLADNAAVWGDPAVTVTSCDPKVFGSMEGSFDIILADVPCSGEGMFRKDGKSVQDWSEANVSLCAARQKRILADVWPSLRQGGVLVYSTCTFEEAENDLNVEWMARELGASILDVGAGSFPGMLPTRTGGLLMPGFVKGEGQFVSAVVKTAPSGRTRDFSSKLRPVWTGGAKGAFKGRDFIPSPDWALSIFPPEDYPRVGLDRESALRFLHRDTLVLPDSPRGYLLVCFEDHPLGFVKNLGSRCNNLHPLNRKIRMEISGTAVPDRT